MPSTQDYYPECPEPMLVGLARTGDRRAFEELVRRRQAPVRALMRRCCNNAALADDLAQQVFLKAWLGIRTLRSIAAFPSWLRRLAVNVWLQHSRGRDALRDAGELPATSAAPRSASPGTGMDLERALATLPDTARLCVVLSYQEGMSHGEIAEATGLPLGTVKSHIRRGSEQLREALSAYREEPDQPETVHE